MADLSVAQSPTTGVSADTAADKQQSPTGQLSPKQLPNQASAAAGACPQQNPTTKSTYSSGKGNSRFKEKQAQQVKDTASPKKKAISGAAAELATATSGASSPTTPIAAAVLCSSSPLPILDSTDLSVSGNASPLQGATSLVSKQTLSADVKKSDECTGSPPPQQEVRKQGHSTSSNWGSSAESSAGGAVDQPAKFSHPSAAQAGDFAYDNLSDLPIHPHTPSCVPDLSDVIVDLASITSPVPEKHEVIEKKNAGSSEEALSAAAPISPVTLNTEADADMAVCGLGGQLVIQDCTEDVLLSEVRSFNTVACKDSATSDSIISTVAVVGPDLLQPNSLSNSQVTGLALGEDHIMTEVCEPQLEDYAMSGETQESGNALSAGTPLAPELQHDGEMCFDDTQSALQAQTDEDVGSVALPTMHLVNHRADRPPCLDSTAAAPGYVSRYGSNSASRYGLLEINSSSSSDNSNIDYDMTDAYAGHEGENLPSEGLGGQEGFSGCENMLPSLQPGFTAVGMTSPAQLLTPPVAAATAAETAAVAAALATAATAHCPQQANTMVAAPGSVKEDDAEFDQLLAERWGIDGHQGQELRETAVEQSVDPADVQQARQDRNFLSPLIANKVEDTAAAILTATSCTAATAAGWASGIRNSDSALPQRFPSSTYTAELGVVDEPNEQLIGKGASAQPDVVAMAAPMKPMEQVCLGFYPVIYQMK